MYQPILSPEQLRNIKEQELLKRMKSLEELLKTTSETATKEIEAIKAEIESIKPEENPWPHMGDEYWYINQCCNIVPGQWTEHPADKFRQSIGLVFRTREEAETKGMKKIERWKMESDLEKFAESINEGWEYDESDGYCILKFDPGIQEVMPVYIKGYIGCIKFKNASVAHTAIDHFGERLIEYLKG